jgi:hypothetical protein
MGMFRQSLVDLPWSSQPTTKQKGGCRCSKPHQEHLLQLGHASLVVTPDTIPDAHQGENGNDEGKAAAVKWSALLESFGDVNFTCTIVKNASTHLYALVADVHGARRIRTADDPSDFVDGSIAEGAT